MSRKRQGPAYYHGGHEGQDVGAELTTGPPHVEDGCPICVARAKGLCCTVGEYRVWLKRQAVGADAATVYRVAQILGDLADAPSHMAMDPPSETDELYVTSDVRYARYYAAVRRGDLYRVEPLGVLEVSTTDNFESFTVSAARVVEVVARRVQLTRRQRRELDRAWRKADKRADRQRRLVQ